MTTGERRPWLLIALVSVAVVSGVVAAAIPTQAVPEKSGLFVDLGNLPVARGPGAPMTLNIDGQRLIVRPPTGYSVVQVSEGRGTNASVTLAPNGPGDTMVIRFEIPDGLNEGSVVGESGGAPIHETRFGLTWRPPGLDVIVSGASQSAQLAAIDGIEVGR